MDRFLDFLSGVGTRALDVYGQIQTARAQTAQQRLAAEQAAANALATQTAWPKWLLLGGVVGAGLLLLVLLLRPR